MISSSSRSILAIDFLQTLFDDLEGCIPDTWELDLEQMALTMETEAGAIFLLNFHSPSQQLWLSSPVSGAHHFEYDSEWISSKTKQPLLSILCQDLRTLCPTGEWEKVQHHA